MDDSIKMILPWYVIREIQIKTMKCHYALTRKTQIQNTNIIKFWQRWGRGKTSHSLLVGMKKGSATLEDNLLVYCKKKKAYLYHMTQGPWFLKHLPKQLVNLCIYINLHKDVYNSFTCNYQNLESVNMFFRWTDKLWSIYMLEYHLLLKNKWCIKPWKHRGNI